MGKRVSRGRDELPMPRPAGRVSHSGYCRKAGSCGLLFYVRSFSGRKYSAAGSALQGDPRPREHAFHALRAVIRPAQRAGSKAVSLRLQVSSRCEASSSQPHYRRFSMIVCYIRRGYFSRFLARVGLRRVWASGGASGSLSVVCRQWSVGRRLGVRSVQYPAPEGSGTPIQWWA